MVVLVYPTKSICIVQCRTATYYDSDEPQSSHFLLVTCHLSLLYKER